MLLLPNSFSLCHASTLRGVARPTRNLNAELLCVLGIQSLPALELHGLGADDASNRLTGEKPIQHIETNVPAGSAHGDEAAMDVAPQRQPRAATKRFEFPPHVEATPVVLKHLRSVGSRHCCFGNLRCGRPHRGELYRGSNRGQAPIGIKRSPLPQMRGVGERLPDSFRRVAQFSDENERPLLSVLLYLRPAGRTGCVLRAITHLFLLFLLFIGVDLSMRSRWRSRASTHADQNQRN